MGHFVYSQFPSFNSPRKGSRWHQSDLPFWGTPGLGRARLAGEDQRRSDTPVPHGFENDFHAIKVGLYLYYHWNSEQNSPG